jgi:hypothetical protein
VILVALPSLCDMSGLLSLRRSRVWKLMHLPLRLLKPLYLPPRIRLLVSQCTILPWDIQSLGVLFDLGHSLTVACRQEHYFNSRQAPQGSSEEAQG